MAPVGQADTQAPQATQATSSTDISLSFTEMAPAVHTSTQREQEAWRLRTATQREGATATARPPKALAISRTSSTVGTSGAYSPR